MGSLKKSNFLSAPPRLGTVIPSIPLRNSAHIICANSLTMQWEDFVPLEDLKYIISNPPFSGSQTMSSEQKAELTELCQEIDNAGVIDYVAGWYYKAAELTRFIPDLEFAYVSTNSITQGRQVAPLFGYLFSKELHIQFAHQTFKWTNEAKGNAGVYCVVIGMGKNKECTKKLFSYAKPTSDPISLEVSEINAYLTEGDERTFVKESDKPLSQVLPMNFGNMPNDNGNLIIEPRDVDEFLQIKQLRPYIKKLIGSKEFLHNIPRYCLWLTEAPTEITNLPIVKERIDKCRQVRLSSKRKSTQLGATVPHLFQERRFVKPPESTIVVPAVSSERRHYIPIGIVDNGTIVTNACHIVLNGSLFELGILESRMHMTWMRTVCGRLESRYRYSRDLCYNTFPWPQVNQMQREQIENLATNVLIAREMHPEMTLAELYDPDKMPDDLKKAHRELDMAVDRLYRKKGFENDEDRLQHLFKRYEALVNGEDVALFED